VCGLVGVINKQDFSLSPSGVELFRGLLWLDTLRGNDGTGVFGITKAGNAEWGKTQGNPTEILEHEILKKNFRAIFGHNRKATSGVISDETAHPFVWNNTITIHNGYIRNHTELLKECGVKDDSVVVDSDAAAAAIAEYGFQRAIEKFEGAMAFISYNADERKLYFARNEDRPLFLVELSSYWVLCSEPNMLGFLLGRDDRYKHLLLDNTKPEDIKPGICYSVDLSKPVQTQDFVEEKFSIKKPVVVQHQYYNQYQYPGNDYHRGEVVRESLAERAINFLDEKVIFVIHGSAKNAENKDIAFGKVVGNKDIYARCLIERPVVIGEILTGTVVGASTKKNKIRLVVEDIATPGSNLPVPKTPDDNQVFKFSLNGEKVYYEEFNKKERKCMKCRGKLSFMDMRSIMWKSKRWGDPIIVCKDCFNKRGF